MAQAVPVDQAMNRALNPGTHELQVGGEPSAPTRSGTLRIEVLAAQHVPAQARAYAEYRLFGGLAAVPGVRSARVTLRSSRGRADADAVVCRIIVVHDDGRCLRLRATGAHTYQAINRATDRFRHLTTDDRRPRPLRRERVAATRKTSATA